MPSAALHSSFLQSEEWRRFQEAVGHETVEITGDGFSGRGVIHILPLVGKYLYFPRGPVIEQGTADRVQGVGKKLLEAGNQENAKWIRIEPRSEEELEAYQNFFGTKLVKSPHDVQPREVLIMDIAPEEEFLLQKMKPKTRYNIRLAEKKGVKVFATREKKHEEAFLELMVSTATRKEITPHPRSHYAHFFSSLPPENLFLFVAEYEGEVLVANLLVVFGETATYLHGGSSDGHREVMAPYLLQWEQIRFAKSQGMKRYDFGGVMTQPTTYNLQPTTSSWAGITRFKKGFTPDTLPTVFPGTYDIVLDAKRYFLYKQLSGLREAAARLKKRLKM